MVPCSRLSLDSISQLLLYMLKYWKGSVLICKFIRTQQSWTYFFLIALEMKKFTKTFSFVNVLIHYIMHTGKSQMQKAYKHWAFWCFYKIVLRPWKQVWQMRLQNAFLTRKQSQIQNLKGFGLKTYFQRVFYFYERWQINSEWRKHFSIWK